MRRNDKTRYEWRKAYKEKEELMIERGYPEVSPYDFYRELFPEGSLQSREQDGKGNIIATQIRPSGKGRTKQWVVDDSLERLDKVVGDEFGLIPPISFYGKSHTKKNAHELYAVAIDIDYVGKQQLKNLLKQFGNGVQLRPTYLVSSGKGVHLYYFLQEPVQLYHNLEDTLSDLKEAFIKRLWNDTSSIRPDSPDITGIYQGFRCVGSQSKLGADYPVKAYKLSENRYTLEDIKASIPKCTVDLSGLQEKPKQEKSKLSLEEAKKLYPEWYQERVVEGRPKKQGTWVCNQALYEWWKGKINGEVKVGGRYFSIMALCACWNPLQKGNVVEFEGVHYTPDMVLGEARKGIKLTYTTDTRPTRSIIQNAEHSDLFVCEGMYGEDDKKSKALEHKHMMFKEAAKLAAEAEVSELWLTHYSPSLVRPEEFMDGVREIFPNAYPGKDGKSTVLSFEEE